MAYDAAFHRSARELEDEGPPFACTPENRARFDEIALRYPPERRRSAVLPALDLAQAQQGYITANAIRHVAEVLGITRADVEDVVSFYTMFYRRPVGRFVVQVCKSWSSSARTTPTWPLTLSFWASCDSASSCCPGARSATHWSGGLPRASSTFTASHGQLGQGCAERSSWRTLAQRVRRCRSRTASSPRRPCSTD
jgi:hypothetical protein